MVNKFPETQIRRSAFSRISTRKSLRLKLAIQRQDISPRDIKTAAACDQIVREREDWVDALVDYAHVISFDKSETRAIRAVDLHDGALFWLVRRTGKAKGFHSNCSEPLAAVQQAEAAWQARTLLRRNWGAVQEMARDLLLGRRRFNVRLDDAHASPLCSMGIAAFRRRMRMSLVTEIPGWLAAVLMWIEPQVGFVIYQAHLRDLQSKGHSATPAQSPIR